MEPDPPDPSVASALRGEQLELGLDAAVPHAHPG